MTERPTSAAHEADASVTEQLCLDAAQTGHCRDSQRTGRIARAPTSYFFQVISGAAAVSGTARYAELLSQMLRSSYGTPIETIRLSRRFPANLPLRARVLVHLGRNDSLAFHFCRQVARDRPDLRLLLLCHDPPHFPNSKRLWMEPLASTRFGRGIRALSNRLWADRFDAELSAISAHWIVMSEAGRKVLQPRLSKLGGSRAPITVIPHGLYEDCAPLQRCEAQDRVQLGFFGHITPTKGLHIVVAALGKLARIIRLQDLPRVIVAGAPDSAHSARYLARIEEEVRRLDLREVVTFRGHLKDHDLPEFFGSIDALLLPYLRPSSCSASGPLHLALTYGRPVICSRSPYFDEAVCKTGIGYVASAGAVQEWSELMRRISNRPALLGDLAQPIAAMRDSQSWQRIAACYYQLMQCG